MTNGRKHNDGSLTGVMTSALSEWRNLAMVKGLAIADDPTATLVQLMNACNNHSVDWADALG